MKCAATTKSGSQCKNSALPESKYCSVHATILSQDGNASRTDSSTARGDSVKRSAGKHRSMEKAATVATIVATVAALAALVTTFAASLTSFVLPAQSPIAARLAEIQTQLDAEKPGLDVAIRPLRAEITSLRSQITKLSSVSEDSRVAARLDKLDTSLIHVGAKLSKLESVILENPSKALEMPLLRKDIDNLKSGHNSELASIRQEIERVYDFNKWFLGLMFTMAVGVLGLAITNFLKKGNTEGT